MFFQLATIEFSAFRLEPAQGQSCVYDRVRVYDGPDETAPLISTHCGTSIPVPIEGTTNQLYVTFTSDRSVTDTGFVAIYAAKDQVGVDGNQGKVTSAFQIHTIKGPDSLLNFRSWW